MDGSVSRKMSPSERPRPMGTRGRAWGGHRGQAPLREGRSGSPESPPPTLLETDFLNQHHKTSPAVHPEMAGEIHTVTHTAHTVTMSPHIVTDTLAVTVTQTPSPSLSHITVTVTPHRHCHTHRYPHHHRHTGSSHRRAALRPVNPISSKALRVHADQSPKTQTHTLTERIHVVNKIICNFENVSAYAAFKTFWQENYSLRVQEETSPC